MPPRATLSMREPGFMVFSSVVESMPFVEASMGVWIVRKSLWGRSSLRFWTSVTLLAAAT